MTTAAGAAVQLLKTCRMSTAIGVRPLQRSQQVRVLVLIMHKVKPCWQVVTTVQMDRAKKSVETVELAESAGSAESVELWDQLDLLGSVFC